MTLSVLEEAIAGCVLTMAEDDPRKLAELLSRMLTNDEARLNALRVLKTHFQTACDASDVFEHLKDCEAALQERVNNLPGHKAALQQLLSEGWETGRHIHYLTDDVTVVGFHEEEGCVVLQYDDETQGHTHAGHVRALAEESKWIDESTDDPSNG